MLNSPAPLPISLPTPVQVLQIQVRSVESKVYLSVVSTVFINSEKQRVTESSLDLGAEIFQLISCFD